QTLDEWQPGVDHHRELPGEHGQALRRDLLDLAYFAAGRGLRRLRTPTAVLDGVDAGDEHLVLAKRGPPRLHGVGLAFAVDRLSRPGSAAVSKSRHLVLPRAPPRALPSSP